MFQTAIASHHSAGLSLFRDTSRKFIVLCEKVFILYDFFFLFYACTTKHKSVGCRKAETRWLNSWSCESFFKDLCFGMIILTPEDLLNCIFNFDLCDLLCRSLFCISYGCLYASKWSWNSREYKSLIIVLPLTCYVIFFFNLDLIHHMLAISRNYMDWLMLATWFSQFFVQSTE